MSAFWFNDAGTWRKAKAIFFNDAGTWRTAKALWFNDAGTWRRVFAAMTVAVSPNPVTGSAGGQSSTNIYVTTATATASVTSGGSGSYTYSWALLSGATATINSPSAAATTFTRLQFTGLNSTTTLTGVFRCTVTDTVTGVQAYYDETVTTYASGSGTPP